jgi:iron complex outermembrane receptor protein
VKEGATLVFSYVGFLLEKAVTAAVNVSLSEEGGQNLNEVVTGSRTAPRSNTTTQLPIDVNIIKRLVRTSLLTKRYSTKYRLLHGTNSSDATSLLDPYEIRNMGPSRTLDLN